MALSSNATWWFPDGPQGDPDWLLFQEQWCNPKAVAWLSKEITRAMSIKCHPTDVRYRETGVNISTPRTREPEVKYYEISIAKSSAPRGKALGPFN